MKKQADYIKRIEIKRLWGRKDISWELRPDVNILSGVNGIGKSTILNRSVNSLSALEGGALSNGSARSFGYIYGREHHVRVNTISQSPTMTTAGSGVKGMDKLFDFANRMSPLGNASADECADYCIVMFSDLTRKVTMQNLFHDGGFSSVGMSLRAMATYEKGLDEYKDENGNIIYG